MVKNQLIKINGTDVTNSRFKTQIEDTIEDQSDKLVIEFSININSLISLPTIS